MVYSIDEMYTAIKPRSSQVRLDRVAMAYIIEDIAKRRPSIPISALIDRAVEIVKGNWYEIGFDAHCRLVGIAYWDASTETSIRAEPFISASSSMRTEFDASKLIVSMHRRQKIFSFLRLVFRSKGPLSSLFREGLEGAGRLRLAERFSRGAGSARCQNCTELALPTELSHYLFEVFQSIENRSKIIEVYISGNRSCEVAAGEFMDFMRNFTAVRQYKLYHDDAANPIGLLIWAWLGQRGVTQLIKFGEYSLSLCDWNEGNLLCLLEMCSTDVMPPQMRADVEGNIFPQESELLVCTASRRLGLKTVLSIERSDRPYVIDILGDFK